MGKISKNLLRWFLWATAVSLLILAAEAIYLKFFLNII